MLRRSLTVKILVAVGATVAVVIAIYTYFVIRLQSTWWQERAHTENLLTAGLVDEKLERAMRSGRRQDVQELLQHLLDSHNILHARIVRPNGLVVFSGKTEEEHKAVLELPDGLFQQTHPVQGSRKADGQTLAVLAKPVMNQRGCISCHDPDRRVLGAVVLESSMEPARAIIARNRNLMIVYGVIILVLVGAVLWLLIVRLVTQPVSGVLDRMREVQAGKLDARAAAESRDEIGELAHGFNRMVGSLAAARDELRESHDKQIRQAGKLATIGELASGIAHEIRNPLAGIGAAVEVLAENGNGNRTGPADADADADADAEGTGDQNRNGESNQEIVAEIHRQIKRLNTTLHDLLDFSRQREPEIEPSAVPDLVKPMLALVRSDARKQKIRIVEEYDPDLPPVCVDMQQIEQVILNLLLNAVQAMPDGGCLTIACRAGDGTVQITITDTGDGIPAETLPKIFSPFFTTKHRGTGLGLAIARSITEKHDGTIEVTSEAGQGTVFTLGLKACCPETLQERSHGTNQSISC
jgi:signal transduction histidine kinase